MLLVSEAISVAPVRPTSPALRELMAAEIDELAEAYFLANRLENDYSNLKSFSWIMSPLIVAAGPLVGGLVDGPSLIAFGAGGAVSGFAALALNLSILRRGKRAKRVRDRHENLEVELLLQEQELKALQP